MGGGIVREARTGAGAARGLSTAGTARSEAVPVSQTPLPRAQSRCLDRLDFRRRARAAGLERRPKAVR